MRTTLLFPVLLLPQDVDIADIRRIVRTVMNQMVLSAAAQQNAHKDTGQLLLVTV
jgi:hypothetical protein